MTKNDSLDNLIGWFDCTCCGRMSTIVNMQIRWVETEHREPWMERECRGHGGGGVVVIQCVVCCWLWLVAANCCVVAVDVGIELWLRGRVDQCCCHFLCDCDYGILVLSMYPEVITLYVHTYVCDDETIWKMKIQLQNQTWRHSNDRVIRMSKLYF